MLFRSVRIAFSHRNAVTATLILLGAETSNGTSSAFLFVPDGAPELSRSMGSILGKWLTNINGGMVAVFKRALHREALVMQFIIRSESSCNKNLDKESTKWLKYHSSSSYALRFHI